MDETGTTSSPPQPGRAVEKISPCDAPHSGVFQLLRAGRTGNGLQLTDTFRNGASTGRVTSALGTPTAARSADRLLTPTTLRQQLPAQVP